MPWTGFWSLGWGRGRKGKKGLKPISWYLDSSRCYLSISRVFVTPSPLVDHTAPFSPTLYFSCTKPIIKSINNWVFFFFPSSLLLNLFLLYISSEMKGRHAGSSAETRRGKRAVVRGGEKKTAQLAFFFFFFAGDCKGWVSMLELLFICENSSSELLRSGSKHLALSPGKGQLTLLRTWVFLSAKQIKEALCKTNKQTKHRGFTKYDLITDSEC